MNETRPPAPTRRRIGRSDRFGVALPPRNPDNAQKPDGAFPAGFFPFMALWRGIGCDWAAGGRRAATAAITASAGV